MKHYEGMFEGTGKLNLYWQSWAPEEPTQAIIAIVHGIGEHSGRYMNVVNALVPSGYAVYAFDTRGHGRSPGQRGHINTWDEFRDDLHAFLLLVRQKEPRLPLFLFGHSLGGVIVLDYCLHSPGNVRGLICSAPAIGNVGIPFFLWQLARFLNRFWPTFSISTQLKASKISRDPAILQAAREDPLTHRQATARFGMQFKQTVERIHAHAAEFRLPLLIVHGTDDDIADPEGSRRFVSQADYPDVTLLEYEGGYHELHNDLSKAQVLSDIKDWLDRHM